MEDHVDDFYFSVFSESDEVLFPICDEKYADELQLQQVLLSCLIAAKKIKPEQPAETWERRVKIEAGQSSSTVVKKEPLPSSSVKLETMPLLCKMCMEEHYSKSTLISEMFSNPNCSHSFCADCLRRYVGSKIGENISAVKCPEVGCKGLIEPENCQGFIPKQVFERWESALFEARILGSNKFINCPFKDCSAVLLGDDEEEEEAGVIIKSECPSCRRMFCSKCEVAWHSGLSCVEYQRLAAGKEQEMDEGGMPSCLKSIG